MVFEDYDFEDLFYIKKKFFLIELPGIKSMAVGAKFVCCFH